MTMLLDSGWVLATWLLLDAACLAWLIRDLRTRNAHLMSLMQWVWILTVLYSGPVGLAIYAYAGRKEIARDSLWRRGFRSVAHCYSGCGAGEVAGILIAVGLLSLGNWGLALLSFTLAYVAGFAMTVGPLLQEGVPLRTALWDAFASESASITMMELTAIGVSLWLAGDAAPGEPRFWLSLILSLSAGLVVAYPVNVLLLRFGIKQGMHNPREVHHHG